MAKPWAAPDENIPAADAAYAQMLADYPPEAIAWMRDATWEGPVDVPLDRIDFDDAGSWAASHEPKKVKRFRQRIQARQKTGKPVKPVVLAHVPGNRHLIVIDGHHRTLACRQLGIPVPAWVGTITSHATEQDADETHAAQKTAPVAAGLAVLAADTGRVLLLQRAGDAEDPASGCWEFPGGHVDPGEKPEDAARREWAEETGLPVPAGQVTGSWTYGVYAGFVLTIPAEADVDLNADRTAIENPDGDLFEDLAWWHRDWLPEDMLRPELAASLGTVRAALGPVAKAMTPGGYAVGQAASEYARRLAGQLGAAVNAGMLAQGWLNAHPRRPRRKHRRRRLLPGGNPPQAPQQRAAPRQYLNNAGVTAALTAILSVLLLEIWAVAWLMGISAAVMLLGLAVTPDDQQALAELDHEGERRLAGIIQTRLTRLERILVQALAEGWTAERLAAEIRNILDNLAAAALITITEAQWASEQATLWAYQQAGITEVLWITMRDSRVCQKCLTAQAAGRWPLGKPFPGTGKKAPPAHPRCRCHLQPAPPQPAVKSPETPELEATPHHLGPHPLWHTPDRHVSAEQKLPNYIEHIAAALIRDQGLSESTAIAYAINAVKRWAKGDLHWGHGKVTPEVQAASQRALDEWEQLKASHH